MKVIEIVEEFIVKSDMIIREEINKMLLCAGIDVKGKTIQEIEAQLGVKGIELSSIQHRGDGVDIVSYCLQKGENRYSVQFQFFYKNNNLKLMELTREGYE